MSTMFAPPSNEIKNFPIAPLVLNSHAQSSEAQERYDVLLRDISEWVQSIQSWLSLLEDPCEKAVQLIAVQLIKDIIRSSDIEESEEAENELYRQLTGRETVLQNIAMDSNELINVRAMAARLFVAKLGRSETELLNHRSSLIRLGVVLGFADARKWDLVKKFINDPHPVVAEEAKELLEDVEG